VKRIGLIKNGVVQSIVVIKDNEHFDAPKKFTAIESESANIGDLYDGSSFSLPPPKRLKREELIAYAYKLRRDFASMVPMGFNLAAPGDDPRIIKILLSECQDDVIQLAYIAEKTGKNVKLVYAGNVVELSPDQAAGLRHKIAERVAYSHNLLASIIGAINSGHICSMADIENPEKATAIKLSSWKRVYG
jgi:hypothetical protein